MAQMQQAADARAAAQSRVRLELLTELVRKDLKVKYKNSALGFVWSLANPLLYLAVFTLVFTFFLRNNVPWFAVMFMSGYLIWSFFNSASLDATGAVVGNANLVRKVRFPRVVLQLAEAGLLWMFKFYMANPMTSVVVAAQRAIYVHPEVIDKDGKLIQVLPAGGYGFYLQWLAVAAAVSVVLLVVGLWTFRRLQADFAEEL
jgi:ABC-type polysaccharide/polyol phosphate export permease